MQACTVEVPDEFNYGLTKRKAIYRAYEGCYPTTPAVDWANCPDGKLNVQLNSHSVTLQDEPQTIELKVGAAVVDEEGRVFAGANVENRSFGLTICAERVAVGAAVAAGAKRIERVAVVAESGVPVAPCGACRQVLAEFGDPAVVIANRDARLRFRLAELLPRSREGLLEGGGFPG